MAENYIRLYWERIQAGEIVACKRLKQQYAKLIDELDHPRDPWVFDIERANRPIEFIETFCRHSKGKWIGKPVRLELWQKAMLQSVFGFVHKETGYRRCREFVMLVGRKNGKSTLLAGIGLYMLVGDAEGGAEVYTVAPLDLDTPILTTRGWTTMGELRVGDQVFAEDGRPTTVTYLSPVVLRKTYRVRFDDGSELIATDNHLWTVEKRYKPRRDASQKYKTVTVSTEEIARSVTYDGRPRYRIKVAAPLRFDQKPLPIDPYVLGVWLGDGRNNRGAITIDKGDLEIIREIERRGYKFSPHYSYKRNLVYGTILGIRTTLRQMGLLENKHIPDVYKRASAEQRMDLLRGLMDTDGTATKSGECRFVSVCERLARDVHELVLGLGFKAHIRSAPTNGRSDVWIVSFKAYDDTPVFNLSRKRERQIQRNGSSTKARYRWIVAVEEVEPKPARCIAVDSPSHLFLAGDRLIATHNTKRDQARIVFSEAVNMVSQSPALHKHIKKRKTDLYFPVVFGKFEPLASESNSLDGLNSHGCIIDELHAIKDRNLYDVMKQSMAAREQPLLAMITTAGFVRECIYDDMYDYACNVLDGVVEDERFLAFIYELDDRSEWTDYRCWEKANPGLGTIKSYEDLAANVERAKNDPAFLPTVLTKDFNVRETRAGTWLTFEQANNEATFDLEELRDTYGIGGVDLSATTDLTSVAAVIMRPGDPGLYVISHSFMPEENVETRTREDKVPYDRWVERGLITPCPGNRIDYRYVTDWFQRLHTEYGINCYWVGYDSWNSPAWVEDMEGRLGYVKGTNLLPVIMGARTLSAPMKELKADLAGHRVNYNHNPVLLWALTNMAVEVDKNENIRPIKGRNQRQRIDPAVALIIAYTVLQWHLEDYKALIGW